MQNIRDQMPDACLLYDTAELFKMFGDSTRIQILSALMICEMSVGDLADLLGMTQSAVSHQLRLLKGGKLVEARRQGKQMIYSLADDHVKTIIGQGLEHVQE